MFVLQEMNALSPSIFDAAKRAGVPEIYRQSDFHLFCPRYDCLKNGNPCTECLEKKSFRPAMKNRCVKNSFSATAVRCESMKFHQRHHLFDSVSAFVAPSAFTCRLLAQSGLPEEKINHIPTFVDTESIVPRFDNDGYFLFFGRISPEKGLENLIRAVSLMKNTDVKVRFLGSGEKPDSLRALIAELGLEKRIEMPGYKSGEELYREIGGALAVVHPAI